MKYLITLLLFVSVNSFGQDLVLGSSQGGNRIFSITGTSKSWAFIFRHKNEEKIVHYFVEDFKKPDGKLDYKKLNEVLIESYFNDKVRTEFEHKMKNGRVVTPIDYNRIIDFKTIKQS